MTSMPLSSPAKYRDYAWLGQGTPHLYMHVLPPIVSLEGVQCEGLPLMVVAALAHEVIPHEGLLLWILHGVGVLPHGSRFGIVMRRCRI